MNRPFYFQPAPPSGSPARVETDLCIYGATSGEVVAAVQARRLGLRVALLAFGERVGGMTTSGLGATDIGAKAAIDGLSRSFYRALGEHYGKAESWVFEPHVAEEVFHRWIKEHQVDLYFNQRLVSVEKNGNEIVSLTTDDGSTYHAKVFIDASYEGDLMAKAGVSFFVGRESSSHYGELYNGVHYHSPFHQFKHAVDPYRIAGDPSSGLLFGISEEPLAMAGDGDHRVQAYNFRLCLTRDDDNKRPILAPDDYDPERYTLMARYLQTGIWDALKLTIPMPCGKTDTNNYGACSTDFIGANYEWPEGSYATRERIFQEHVSYTRGLFWFLANDERVPRAVRDEAGQWGLPKDEFIETGGWPPELYIREARRMVSDYVMTERNCVGRERVEDVIALAAYTMDSHNCRRAVVHGRVINEGNCEIGGFPPYPITYRAITPRESEAGNLLVPFCLSASHIAFGSIRMEPVFMALAQAAATAASLAIRSASPVQRVDYSRLRTLLLEDKQVLEWDPALKDQNPAAIYD